MKAILKKKESLGFELEDLPIPEPEEGQVLVKVRATAICGSDLKLYEWTPWCKSVVKSLPFIPGHECSGEVVKVGKGVKGIKVGDKVAAETHIPCGKCWQCRHNRPHTCQNMELFGHTVNGCFAEYCIIPEISTRKLPEEFPLEKGCLLEPMGIPLRAVYEGEVEGDSVVVIGCGPIGQFAIGISRIRGAEKVIAIDINEKRLDIASKMGATHLINPQKESVVEKVLSLTEGNGAGVIIEASGNAEALERAFGYLRVGGKLFTIGHPQRPLKIDVSSQIIFKEAKIVGLWGRQIWKTWEIAENLLSTGKLNVKPMVTHKFSLQDFEEAFRVAISGEGCKIVLVP
ncbi:alcohol dehydrogenase catalytic domain-containing protein [Candidatus Aerophobetes bacterium]|nr:alcohol dehydrogenase catalytic domain-containing protein [Candidatus Aerophobetes bacterium]HHJ00616.1 L-threonine 3-dehydrogenase [Candidatus Aerophobetes bacterium]